MPNKLDFPTGKGKNVRIVIYVPSTTNIDKKIPNSQFRRRITSVVNFLRSKLGGSTRVLGIGNYYSDDLNKSITEKVAKVESFTTTKDYYREDKKIRKFLLRKKKAWKQEWLSYEYRGSLYFV